jgi:DNA polymerase III sliding clamp (beta) subunit (PCNA family)
VTKVVFETATLADAIKKADRIAPSKGQAFDKAAGIVLNIDTDTGLVVVRATNLDLYSMEWVDTVSIEGETTMWRVPSALFARVLKDLPIGTGKEVVLEEKTDGRVRMLHLTSGRTRAKFNLMVTDYYPEWEVFDPTGLMEVDDLGGRVAQIEWAASIKEEPPLAGVHIDGERVIACDRYRLAIAPLPIPDLVEPITVPSGLLSQVLKQTGGASIGVRDGQLLIMPDKTTQIKTVVYGAEYPPVERIMKRDHSHVLKVKKTPLIEIMQRAANFAGNDRFPILRVFFGQEEVAVMMNTQEVGALADVLEVPGYCDHKRFEVKFTPKNLLEALNAVPNDELELFYDTSDSMMIVRIDGGSGYEAWVMPRKDLSVTEKQEQEKANAEGTA